MRWGFLTSTTSKATDAVIRSDLSLSEEGIRTARHLDNRCEMQSTLVSCICTAINWAKLRGTNHHCKWLKKVKDNRDSGNPPPDGQGDIQDQTNKRGWEWIWNLKYKKENLVTVISSKLGLLLSLLVLLDKVAKVVVIHTVCTSLRFLASCFPWWHRCKTLVTWAFFGDSQKFMVWHGWEEEPLPVTRGVAGSEERFTDAAWRIVAIQRAELNTE